MFGSVSLELSFGNIRWILDFVFFVFWLCDLGKLFRKSVGFFIWMWVVVVFFLEVGGGVL